ncbi:MAG: hypothetical protein INH41_10870 [Myxococcaceae bacterium]|nr:hypothetical protein [Myxococcaceae bacterium]
MQDGAAVALRALDDVVVDFPEASGQAMHEHMKDLARRFGSPWDEAC